MFFRYYMDVDWRTYTDSSLVRFNNAIVWRKIVEVYFFILIVLI